MDQSDNTRKYPPPPRERADVMDGCMGGDEEEVMERRLKSPAEGITLEGMINMVFTVGSHREEK